MVRRPFTRRAVEEKKLAEWESNEPDAALRYPPRNVYIAERFELKAGSETRLAAAKKAAGLGRDDAASHRWSLRRRSCTSARRCACGTGQTTSSTSRA